MNRSGIRSVITLILAGSMLFAGCGGGGGGESSVSSVPSGPATVLDWDPPETYNDSTPLDPYTELDYYEFYVRGDDNFTDNDLPVAQVAAVEEILSQDGTTYLQNLIMEFDLQNLLPFVPPGTIGYLSIRAVGVNGLRSDFSQPVVWNLAS